MIGNYIFFVEEKGDISGSYLNISGKDLFTAINNGFFCCYSK